MEIIKKYRSDDGLEFLDERACLLHERLTVEVRERLATLHAAPTDPNSSTAYIQQRPEAVLELQSWLVAQVERASGQLFPGMKQAALPIGFTIVGRYQDDCGPAAIRGAWYRLMCMDNLFREWGQPYFALQANKRIP
jgi:hypothetical protein